jgi:hypothetical protein
VLFCASQQREAASSGRKREQIRFGEAGRQNADGAFDFAGREVSTATTWEACDSAKQTFPKDYESRFDKWVL